ncbi:hypothetical protein [Janthinobacterium agaricidamnosum]|uniref:Lipoprotein n=1 Tax=Janthinobacterium agaricidamnosum NBRC 102515 = DSM 9628 TaxID=1349767 RepID=W0V935_9BURK|nr:hypothetical protein [Janthinobacterium agaricidamnosum]CDG85339.1 hypothetical protein GJA_4735 [Janthinobacterium agaricidamnosum NBRC 102515 = DSM 9628]
MNPSIFPTLLRPLLRGTCAALSLLLLGACGSAPAEPATPVPEVSSAQLLQKIQDQAANTDCDGPQQCHTVALGAKACGGPDMYLAWSSKNNDGKTLRELAARYAEASRLANQTGGMLSTCAIVSDPGATCQAGHCVLLKAGPGGVPAV